MNTQRGSLSSSLNNSSAVKSCLPSQSACRISGELPGGISKKCSHDDEPILAEKESAHMEGPFSLIENSFDRHAREEQEHGILHSSINKADTDEIQDNRHTVIDLCIQASEEKREVEAMEKGSTQWDGSSSPLLVTPISWLPSSKVKPGRKLPMESRMRVSEKGTKIAGVLEDNVEHNNIKLRTRSINCIVHCQSNMSIPMPDCINHRHTIHALDEATAKQCGTGKVKSKGKGTERSRNFELTIEYEAKETRVKRRPKKVNDQYVDEIERNKRRPKKAKRQLADQNECEVDKNPKAGRPKKVKDHMTDDKNMEKPKKRKRKRRSTNCPLIFD